MCAVRRWGTSVCALLSVLWGVAGGGAARAEDCAAGAKALGVSRVLSIDATTGPRFGSPYGEAEILADGEIVLTFDDGPMRATSKVVLDALAAQCTKATFFVVGRMAIADPEMVQEYDRRGHTVATHTWSHANLADLTPLKARAEIELGISAAQQALGKPVAPFFRFPYLRDPPSASMYLASRRLAVFSVDIDSKDYRTRDAIAVHQKVMADLARLKKGIILFHDIQPSTARALPGLLAELKAKGYRVVHLMPAATATSLAAYDNAAARALARRRAAASEQPLLERSLTWPTTSTVLPRHPTAARESPAAGGHDVGAAIWSEPGAEGRSAPSLHQDDAWGIPFWRLY
jgi:peptidoglycan/xylan/chitin deacetylase (PgdA/CDA1 family)